MIKETLQDHSLRKEFYIKGRIVITSIIKVFKAAYQHLPTIEWFKRCEHWEQAMNRIYLEVLET